MARRSFWQRRVARGGASGGRARLSGRSERPTHGRRCGGVGVGVCGWRGTAVCGGRWRAGGGQLAAARDEEGEPVSRLCEGKGKGEAAAASACPISSSPACPSSTPPPRSKSAALAADRSPAAASAPLRPPSLAPHPLAAIASRRRCSLLYSPREKGREGRIEKKTDDKWAPQYFFLTISTCVCRLKTVLN